MSQRLRRNGQSFQGSSHLWNVSKELKNGGLPDLQYYGSNYQHLQDAYSLTHWLRLSKVMSVNDANSYIKMLKVVKSFSRLEKSFFFPWLTPVVETWMKWLKLRVPKPTKLNLQSQIYNQTYPTKSIKPNLPNQTYKTKPTKPNLLNLALLIELKHSTLEKNLTLGSVVAFGNVCIILAWLQTWSRDASSPHHIKG